MTDIEQFPQYYVAYDRPVALIQTESGGLAVLVFTRHTGAFEYNRAFLDEVWHRPGNDSERVTEDEFIQQIERMRGLYLRGEGTVYALYEVINALEDAIKDKPRRLTEEEGRVIEAMRRETHELFNREELGGSMYPPDLRPAKPGPPPQLSPSQQADIQRQVQELMGAARARFGKPKP